ncbi:hypothetical protein J6TS7_18080 [Paenibacillus dendritiformis]|nr:hypothetical protein J6TS7_18080 [Paenibacillus dendritiformis]
MLRDISGDPGAGRIAPPLVIGHDNALLRRHRYPEYHSGIPSSLTILRFMTWAVIHEGRSGIGAIPLLKAVVYIFTYSYRIRPWYSTVNPSLI